jgi:PQQ-like domain
MKIRCSCGTKYEFDVTPEMVQNPVRFVCQNCGLDSSEYVNQLVREELAQEGVIATPPPAVAPRLKIAPEAAPAPAPEAAPVSKFCPKHRGVPVTEKCLICQKPICPQCMELFGYFCSPLCKNKADLQGIAAPVYAGQSSRVEARFWRKAGLIFGSLATAGVLFLGVWIWYAWFGSVPHPYFSVRFEDTDRAYAGTSWLVGKDQIVFLHGGTLARYDLKTKKPVWSQELVSKGQIDAIVKTENDARARDNAAGNFDRIPPAGSQEREAKIALQSELSLHGSGQNIWVAGDGKLTHYDWDSGKMLQEVALPESGGELVERDGELQIAGVESVTHINLANGGTHTENIQAASAGIVASAPGANRAGNSAMGGLPMAGSDNSRPLDPNTVASEAQNLKIPARIALPALLANASHEQQLEAALKDDPQYPRSPNSNSRRVGTESFQLIPAENGFVQFSSRLLEQHIVTREAMQAPPKKSVLNGDLNATKTTDVANEMLNEMQRNNGGDTVSEDASRYQVTVRLPNSPDITDWTGEVTGPPQLFVLKTVNVIAAGKTVIVLDKSNKKLWSAALTYNVSGGGDGGFAGRESQFGAGPCVEHGDTLYVFDQAVLSAFDLTTGNARWRLPSVGIVGLFFDEQGNVYVNTTTGNPDDIRYSRQIDINKSTQDVVSKIDPKTGRTLWSVQPGGFISYLSGKFIYTIESYDPNPLDEEVLSDTLQGLQKPAYLRIARIDPKNGHVMWEYYDRNRCPIDVRFDGNSIELIFKREVQVLKYLTL